jgi:hypothetical protein
VDDAYRYLDWFTLEESAKLLKVIYPDYPTVRYSILVPDLAEFLKELREKK